MSAPFRSAFYGSSGFVAARSAARVVEAGRQVQRPALRAVECAPARPAQSEQAKAPEALAA